MFRRGRKGDTDSAMFIIIFDLMMLGFLLLGLLTYVNSIEDNTHFDKKFISRDVALLVDTIYASPNDISCQYDSAQRPISDFDISFDNKRAIVTETGNPDALKLYYPFAADKFFQSDYENLVASETLYIDRYGSIFRISGTPSEKSASTCSVAINTTNVEWRNSMIFLDPGIGIEELQWSEYPDKNIMWVIGKQLRENGLTASFIGGDYPGKPSVSDKIKYIKEQKPALVIGLHPSQAAPSVIPITIYYNAESINLLKNKKLACSIMNQFAQDKTLNENFQAKEFKYVIQPLSISTIDDEDPRKILTSETVGIVIEIGNIVQPSGESIYDGSANAQYRIIADIYEGLKVYYE